MSHERRDRAVAYVRRLFRWPGGALWMLLTPPVYVWTEVTMQWHENGPLLWLFAVFFTTVVRSIYLSSYG